MSKDAYYFPHDSNAFSDPKILQLRTVYGLEGYGLYWAIIEKMREQTDFRLPIKGKYTLDAYAQSFGVSKDKLENFINDCINEFKDGNEPLFYNNDGYIWSESLNRRMATFTERSAKARQAALIRWGDMPTQSDGNADAKHPQSDGNASKVKYSKVNKVKYSKEYIVPDFIDKILWNDFLDMRKKIRKPPTDRAIELLLKDLEKFKNSGDDPNEIIRQSIKNNWQGLFPLRRGLNGTYSGNNKAEYIQKPGNRPAGAFRDIE